MTPLKRLAHQLKGVKNVIGKSVEELGPNTPEQELKEVVFTININCQKLADIIKEIEELDSNENINWGEK